MQRKYPHEWGYFRMQMKSVSTCDVTTAEFLEVVIMWHCAGDIPMDRVQTVEFIERPEFTDFLQSVHFWAKRFGVEPPSHSDVVRTLHRLYS